MSSKPSQPLEIRYRSEMSDGPALHSRHPDIESALAEKRKFIAQVLDAPVEPKLKKSIIKSIEVY